MKIKPGRPRGYMRLARTLGLDRNPLRRPTDRVGARRESAAPSGRTDQVLTAVMTLAALGLVLLAVLRLALALVIRRRLAAWETAWSKAGPQWSKRRP